VEVAETARVQLEPTYRNAKIRVFLAKIRYLHKLPIASADPDTGKPILASTRWPKVPCTGTGTDTREQKVGLLVVGYVNEASHFDQHVPEYESFLSKISQGSATQPPSAGVAHTRSSSSDQGSP
jgi:hypothetical protein